MVEKIIEKEVPVKKDLILLEQYSIEITTLNARITAISDVYMKIKGLYEGLLLDIKAQLNLNETLKKSVIELESKIELYNLTISNYDLAVLQQLEIISKHGRKQNIDFQSQKAVIKLAEDEISYLKKKISQLESEKVLSTVEIYSSLNLDKEIFSEKKIGFISAKTTDFVTTDNLNISTTTNEVIQGNSSMKVVSSSNIGGYYIPESKKVNGAEKALEFELNSIKKELKLNN